ncbi:GNAT family N-acetyltransferase [Streptomyces poriferorum]|uniref:GNAT family N-acetyltransferase n=1 Tax=Streptomyces poriferorum TaxID=2798799 RepID=UPI001C60594F|nr:MULTISPECIES: GNAT family N-acetyltransferase [Streptomyces]MBW5252863.1 GNAT family N-acetyltransferase [Streptomyces poriferorum]MBW5260888.1 GNAT family N-acetyltransferase [Streptomyces poriferorum]WLQ46020.1 GNAT family N-acetyltransferase [Streptomyces sp. Alt1]
MTVDANGDKAVFRRAAAEHMDKVLSVLDEAAGWLEARGVSQWPSRFEAAWVEKALTRGETWLVEIGGKVAGTVTVDWSDPLWADLGGPAGYVHRMAVRRWAAGLGSVILDWAGDIALQRGANALRLDCVNSNRHLRSYYEAQGFVHRGDVPVGGAPGQRQDDGPVTWVSRYEQALTRRRAADRAPGLGESGFVSLP